MGDVEAVENLPPSIAIEQAAPSDRLPAGLRALRSRNFALYFAGLVLSQIGTWMQKTAELWVVYELSHSALTLGVVGFISLLPLVPMSLVAGTLSDRMSRKMLLLIANVGLIFPPLILAALIWTHTIQVWHIVVADFMMGLLTTIDQPARQAMIVDVVPPEDLSNAIGLGSSGLNAAGIVGPAIAGLLIAAVGAGWCFALNGVSYLAVVIALVLMRVTQRIVQHKDSVRGSTVKGLTYLIRQDVILALIGVVVVITVFLAPYQTLLPVFAKDILNSGADGYGLLRAAAGLGAVLGGLGVAYLARGKRGKYILATVLVASVATVLFALSTSFILSNLALVVVGAGITIVKAQSFTLIHEHVQDEMRGRVISVVVMLSGGMPAVGGLAAGFIASRWSAPMAVGLGAVAFLLVSLLLFWQLPKLQQLA